jgi:thiol-disulfide isomerase/thioredoxin
MKKLFFSILAFSILPVSAQQTLKQGNWRGEFVTRNAQIPFQFEVKGTSVFLLNGSERAELSPLTKKGDSVYIPVILYDAVLAAKLSDDGQLSGRFKKLSTEKPDTGIYFTAKYGNLSRFDVAGTAPAHSLDGKWEVRFINPGDTELTVGLFAQAGAKLTGTIMTPSGDYRYLEGLVDGDNFKLSAFGGSNPYLFDGKFTGNDSFEGTFYTARGKTAIKGLRNNKAELPDPYSLTGLQDGVKKLNFSFPNLQGQKISINDEQFKNKVVVVTILGSWCPNCMDETAFLAPWYLKNKKRGVEVIGLAFERKNDLTYAKSVLGHLIDKYNIQYNILFAGQTGANAVANALPELKSFFSFPTMIFIDKKGVVRKIHAGFNGPATGKYYQEFIEEFNREIDSLIAD